jgi:hypothetical protein
MGPGEKIRAFTQCFAAGNTQEKMEAAEFVCRIHSLPPAI